MASSEDVTEIRAVLFDVYGTLAQIRTPRHPFRQLLNMVRSQRPSITKRQGVRDVMCQPLGLADVAKLYRAVLTPEQLSTLEQDLEAEIRSLALYPEASSVLHALRERGYRIGVCSNLAAPYVRPVARLLEGLIDTSIWSCEVGSMKPDREIYDLATNCRGFTPDQVLMLGDNYRADVEGPRLVGLRALHLKRSGVGGDLSSLEGLLHRLPPINRGGRNLPRHAKTCRGGCGAGVRRPSG